jgi:energy-coupling factor transporter ATP-binding protein EcfA2/SAM-dependent methyltransferase
MRIEAINLSRRVFESMGIGLPTLPMDEPLQLRDFGQCVVIAGKNGSGKTRLLRLLNDVAMKYITPDARHQIEYDISQNVSAKKSYQAEVARIEAQGLRDGENPDQLERHRRGIASADSEIERLRQMLRAAEAVVISGEGSPKIVFFVPKSTGLKDPADGNETEATQQADSFASGLAAEGAHIGAPAYARLVMRAATRERGARVRGSDSEKHDAETELIGALSTLLGEAVGFELTDTQNLKLVGLSDRYESLLSEGQKVLFQLACMLHARQAMLKDCILFLDEPENHLHPAVLNDLVDRLREVLTDGQLWIATHSVPLIAHLSATDPDCLWFAESGKFSRAGRAPAKVLNSLLGGPDGASRVNDLTLLASRYASFLLLRQCLLPPGVIGYDGQDPQLNQIREVLDRFRPADRPLKILDFGSGKGRLLAAIADAAADRPVSEFIDYLAYEKWGDEAEHCQKRCEELYGTEEKPRAFKSLDALQGAHGEKFADIVIVCNVLHEVRPAEWLDEFGASSALARLLKDDGHVLFVEDYAIPVGERAHEHGFLLLDEPELRLLFEISESDFAHGSFHRSDHVDQNYRGRLIAHVVSARCLARLSENSRWKAIRSLHDRSLSRLQNLLEHKHDITTANALGRESALVTQLVANSALWLRDNHEFGAKVAPAVK